MDGRKRDERVFVFDYFDDPESPWSVMLAEAKKRLRQEQQGGDPASEGSKQDQVDQDEERNE